MDLQEALEKFWIDYDLPGEPCIEHDNDGQIVIYTNMKYDEETGEFREMNDEDFKYVQGDNV